MNKSINDIVVDYSLGYNLDKDILLKYQFFPLQEYDIYYLVAVVDNMIDIDQIEKLFSKPVKVVYISKKVFEFEIKNLEYKYHIFELSKKAVVSSDENDLDISLISMFAKKLFEFAISLNTSDIHIETLENSLIIRFRIDGMLIQLFRFEYNLYYILSASLKLFAALDISQKRLPQNGRFSKNILNKSYDFRISILPINNGESIVIRILDNTKAFIKLEDIGFETKVYNQINKYINTNQGLILITGPTGSGKTTTLYSILNKLNNQNKKIISLEDPVEYNIEGIQQVSINSDIGLDYDIVLKNILRQDPDIIMIGEIRDAKTLSVAIQAALTGHLIIATLHTNSAAKTLNRLFDLKAEPFLIASVLKLIVSQRLIRLLCNNCKKSKKIGNQILYEATGCSQCNLSGYKNRTIITESLQIDETIAQMIHQKQSIRDIVQYADCSSINENSYNKVLNGETSLEEYYRHEI